MHARIHSYRAAEGNHTEKPFKHEAINEYKKEEEHTITNVDQMARIFALFSLSSKAHTTITGFSIVLKTNLKSNKNDTPMQLAMSHIQTQQFAAYANTNHSRQHLTRSQFIWIKYTRKKKKNEMKERAKEKERIKARRATKEPQSKIFTMNICKS